MDAETLAGGRDRTKGFAPEKRRTFHRGTLAEPYLGGLCPLHWNVGPGRPMTSSSIMDVLGDNYGSFVMCGRVERPKEG
jgi:hypothetical protein